MDYQIIREATSNTFSQLESWLQEVLSLSPEAIGRSLSDLNEKWGIRYHCVSVENADPRGTIGLASKNRYTATVLVVASGSPVEQVAAIAAIYDALRNNAMLFQGSAEQCRSTLESMGIPPRPAVVVHVPIVLPEKSKSVSVVRVPMVIHLQE